MSKLLAITLIEMNNPEAPNIGTIVSESGSEEELRTKAIKALESHFDAEVKNISIQDELGFSDVRNSHPLDASIILDEGGYSIEIQQTFIY